MSRLVSAALEAAGYIAFLVGASAVLAGGMLLLLWLPSMVSADPMVRMGVVAGELLVMVWAVVTVAFWRASADA